MPTLSLENGRILGYEEWGVPDGMPIFSLHGSPGCRLDRHPDTALWPSLHLHVITMDRPGYGLSTALPGRKISHAASDVAAVANRLGLDRFMVIGGSSGGPHALACAAGLGDRIQACILAASGAPLREEEIDRLVAVNRQAYRRFRDEGRPGLVNLLTPQREHLLANPVQFLHNKLADATPADLEWSSREDVQRVRREAIVEALRPGVEGWVDDTVSLFSDDWNVDFAAITCPTSFWHSDDDKNAPLSAVQRLVAQVVGTELHTWHGEGHSAPSRHMHDILRQLIDTAQPGHWHR